MPVALCSVVEPVVVRVRLVVVGMTGVRVAVEEGLVVGVGITVGVGVTVEVGVTVGVFAGVGVSVEFVQVSVALLAGLVVASRLGWQHYGKWCLARSPG